MPLMPVQAKYVGRWAITIPANGGTGSSILALLQAAGYMGHVNAVIIDGWLAGTSGIAVQRPAFLAASPRAASTAIASTDFSAHGQYVPAGQLYYVPAEDDKNDTYVQSTNGSTIVALATVLL